MRINQVKIQKMSINIDKSLILNEIKSHLSFKKDKDFADFLGIKPQTLNSWYARNVFDYELIVEKCPDIDANWLFRGSGNMIIADKNSNDRVSETPPKYQKTNGIPLIPIEAMAGNPNGDDTALYIDAERYFIPEFNKRADYLIRISGNSMSPEYYNGDIVACKRIPSPTFIQWGKVYILDTVQGAICKRLFEGNKQGSIKAVSDNDRYPPFELSLKNDVRNMAIVVGVIRLK